jgi:hypothetical protein
MLSRCKEHPEVPLGAGRSSAVTCRAGDASRRLETGRGGGGEGVSLSDLFSKEHFDWQGGSCL